MTMFRHGQDDWLSRTVGSHMTFMLHSRNELRELSQLQCHYDGIINKHISVRVNLI